MNRHTYADGIGCLLAADGSASGGTLDFMPPEQLVLSIYNLPRGLGYHQGRADVYSVGVCLWSLLLGQDPFHRCLQTGQPQQRDMHSLLHVKGQLVSPSHITISCDPGMLS